MAVTISIYNHVPKLILNKDIDFSNLKVELLNNTPTFNGTHTTKQAADGAAANATVTMTIASPGVITDTAHGFSASQAIKLKTTGALPTGLTANTWYYVKNPTTNTYELSATPGGASINTTGSQSGVHTRYASSNNEVYGNGWPAGGPTLANVTQTQAAITDVSVNDAMLDADDVSVVASGGSIGPTYKALLYDHTNEYPIAFIDFGGSQAAGDTTEFKIRWSANGILDLTM
jgi:hypothetical protein